MADTTLFSTLTEDEVRSLQRYAWMPSKDIDVSAWRSPAYSLAIDALLALDILYEYHHGGPQASAKHIMRMWNKMLGALDDLASPADGEA